MNKESFPPEVLWLESFAPPTVKNLHNIREDAIILSPKTKSTSGQTGHFPPCDVENPHLLRELSNWIPLGRIV